MKLAEFQDAFVDALYQRPHPGLEALSAQPAFAVYRNTVIKGCVDALCDNFPAVQRLVGEAWMRAAAAHFAEQHPPQDARLVHYGAGFADFLDSLPATRELPYLAPVARLEWLWLEAFTAPLEPALTLAGLAGHDPAGLDALCLRPGPARAGAGSTSSRSTPSGTAAAKACRCPNPCRGTAKACCWWPRPKAYTAKCWAPAAAPSSTPAPPACPWAKPQPRPWPANPRWTLPNCWAG